MSDMEDVSSYSVDLLWLPLDRRHAGGLELNSRRDYSCVTEVQRSGVSCQVTPAVWRPPGLRIWLRSLYYTTSTMTDIVHAAIVNPPVNLSIELNDSLWETFLSAEISIHWISVCTHGLVKFSRNAAGSNSCVWSELSCKQVGKILSEAQGYRRGRPTCIGMAEYATRRININTRSSQHSEGCNDPRWQCFVTRDFDLWLWPFIHIINGFPERTKLN